jgi:hypothetical protein
MDTLERKQRRDRITKLFLRELGIEDPTDKQIEFMGPLHDRELTRPIIVRLKKNGSSYGAIANKLKVNSKTVCSAFIVGNKNVLNINKAND